MPPPLIFESLPVELIVCVLSELDIPSLINTSYASTKLNSIASDPSLNPWRRPILCALRSQSYHDDFRSVGVRRIIPRQNWIEILTLASPSFLLYEATLPNLTSDQWEEAFHRRFLPGWTKWKRDDTWKKVFLKTLHRVQHRRETSCTADESWTKYITLNRNGTANQLEITSRNFNSLALFHQMKLQNNLSHLETRIRLVVEFIDVRILAFGTLNRPRSKLTLNYNARVFLHPPGVGPGSLHEGSPRYSIPNTSPVVEDYGIYPIHDPALSDYASVPTSETYTRLARPVPAPSYSNYPYYTPGGGDRRWLGEGEVEEEGLHWVGPLMIITQLIGMRTHESSEDQPSLQDSDLITGPGRTQYASFTWADLWAIAPWLKDKITRKIDGPGLGH